MKLYSMLSITMSMFMLNSLAMLFMTIDVDADTRVVVTYDVT